MKGLYNNQGRKSGGYKKSKILVGNKLVPLITWQCFEQRHAECNQIDAISGNHIKCECKCHQAFIAPGDIKYKIKRRKYPSFQNSLNRRKK